MRELEFYGHPLAYDFLGGVFEQGLGGFKPDIHKAIKYYKDGADDDIGDCAFSLTFTLQTIWMAKCRTVKSKCVFFYGI